MDPMDYTMDEGQNEQPPNTAPNCQYHPPDQSSNPNLFPPPSRDAHRYDPVHNTDSWYQPERSGGQNRPQFPVPQNIPQWNPGSYTHIDPWQAFGGEAHAGDRGSGLSDYGPQTRFMGISHSTWNGMRGYEPLSFGYTSYMNAPNANAAPVDTSNGRNASSGLISSATASAMPQPDISALQAEYARRATRPDPSPSSNTSPENHNYSQRARATRTAREERAALQASNLSRSLDYHRAYGAPDLSNVNQRDATGWESDDDDDAGADPEVASYRRTSQHLFDDYDDERALAAMRGALAAGKKIPSKEALASLEKLAIKDLKEGDKSCMICYNEFGVENLEGVIEHPIRLPKCKHIFGEKCIKKWFEDSDSCPYCRDKLPSELAIRKNMAFENLRAHRERLAAITTQAQAYRARHGIPSHYPSIGELSVQERTSYVRHSQEEYHYFMRGNLASEPWSYSTSNRGGSQRDSPDSRRRQARGRAGLGRPTSVGSSRFVAAITNQQNTSQRAQLANFMPNTQTSGPPRRSATPGLGLQSSGGAPPSGMDVNLHNRALGITSSSEEASPSVAIGSGVASTANPQHNHGPYSDQSVDQWSDPFGQRLNRNTGASFPSLARYRTTADDFDGRALSLETGTRTPYHHDMQRLPDISATSNTRLSMENLNQSAGQNGSLQNGTDRSLQNRWPRQF